MRTLALVVLLPLFAAAPAAPGVDRCADPKKYVGRWEGTMKCTSGVYPATAEVEPSPDPESCVYATWSGKKKRTASDGRLRVSVGTSVNSFVLFADPVTSLMRSSEMGRAMTISPDPKAGGLAKLVRFSGVIRADDAFKKASVNYTWDILAPGRRGPEVCSGKMMRVAP